MNRRVVFLLLVNLMMFGKKGFAQKPEIIMAYPEKYSREFIQELEKNNYSSSYRLIDSLFIAGADTFHFPTDLPFNDTIRFIGRKHGRLFNLEVKRINLTSMNYFLTIVEDNQPFFSQGGIAHLAGGFFLGAETDEDEAGEAYLASEYYDKNPAGRVFLRVSSGEDFLKVKVITSCKDRRKSISLGESAVLFEIVK